MLVNYKVEISRYTVLNGILLTQSYRTCYTKRYKAVSKCIIKFSWISHSMCIYILYSILYLNFKEAEVITLLILNASFANSVYVIAWGYIVPLVTM